MPQIYEPPARTEFHVRSSDPTSTSMLVGAICLITVLALIAMVLSAHRFDEPSSNPDDLNSPAYNLAK